ncbi:hypothetical protein H9P43_001990 [Blastocladiella emersonii ATCC 22665]|nr:hypothetical protein H9P43_001990 [Blastocladiella emersonii ATCC 22665]
MPGARGWADSADESVIDWYYPVTYWDTDEVKHFRSAAAGMRGYAGRPPLLASSMGSRGCWPSGFAARGAPVYHGADPRARGCRMPPYRSYSPRGAPAGVAPGAPRPPPVHMAAGARGYYDKYAVKYEDEYEDAYKPVYSPGDYIIVNGAKPAAAAAQPSPAAAGSMASGAETKTETRTDEASPQLPKFFVPVPVPVAASGARSVWPEYNPEAWHQWGDEEYC